MLANPPITITCSVTARTVETTANADGSPKLPRGWKRHGGQLYSPQGWGQSHVARSLRLPVASVVLESAADDREGGWKAFWSALDAAWGEATRYANLALSHYAARDFAVPLVKTDRGPRLPKIERETQNAWRREVYALHHDFPALDATSAAAISLECWRSWNAGRWDVRITGEKSLPTFRFPFPLPLPAQGVKWSVAQGNGWITVRLRVNGRAFLVRLSGDRRFARHLRTLREAIESPAAGGSLGEVSLLRRRRFDRGENHQQAGWSPWVAVTVALPKRPRGELDAQRTLAVKTGGGDLFRARVDDQERVWALHADDLLGRIETYERSRQRLSDDRKFERRRGLSGSRYLSMTEDRVRRHKNWLDVQLHRRSRELVAFAQRNRCGRIELDASAPLPDLPMFRLIEKIRQKADECGIVVRAIGDEPVGPDASAAVT